MKYMMFVATDPEPDRHPEAPHEIEDWLADVDGRGKRIIGDRLGPARGEDVRGAREGDGDGRPIHRFQGSDRRLRYPGMRDSGGSVRNRGETPDGPRRPFGGEVFAAGRG